ncbi:HD-GYP domain-containing protein [Shewanella gelidii]|uniref:HD family phosphohydrolase n=1 Tax=Shewanella gelidii TaxID=1642821 RepID=A0A917ND31_9GAMM|nr:DUF3391 domain-containing protein [Shewanella gelidii]MCL1098695.1 DUF3391 domain-containing protein [Shewanella gelidii]GGI86002.1 HD family phosphohydrolase [Shewanella gelidii]
MSKIKKIPVGQLKVGSYVQLPLSWKDHPFLFSNFKIKQAAQLALIKKLPLDHVYINLEKCEDIEIEQDLPQPEAQEINDLSKSMHDEKAARIEAFKKMRRSLTKTEKNFDRSIAKMRSLITKLRSRPLTAVTEAQDLIHDITNQLLSSDNLVLHLMGDAKNDEGIYYHSLNVAVLSMLVAKELKWSQEEIENVGLAALFHDIGMLKVPSQLLRKQTALTTAEINFMKQHPSMGADLAKLAENFPEKALPLIQNHHEFLDGTGYPKGLKKDQLDPSSQLIAVINQYDELCHPNQNIKARTPYSALGYLFKNFKEQLNQEHVGQMIKMLGVYPPGSVVELSSGQFGIVMGVNLDKLLLPKIMVYDTMVPKEQAPIIDLESENLSIVRCLPPAALPEKIFKYLNPRERVNYFFGSESN